MSHQAPGLPDNKRVGLRSALVKPVRWFWSVRGVMLLCGALLVLTFPDANFEYLAWFGLVPGLVLIARSPTAREGGVRAWWLGAGYLIAALYWMAPEIGPGVLLVAVVFGFLWVPFGVAAQKLLRPPVSWPRALAALVVDLTGSRSQIAFKPLPIDDPRQRCPDITKAQKLLGWRPSVKLKDGLSRTIAYFDRLLGEGGEAARRGSAAWR